ncbi:MAG: hypothetical protein KBA86_00205 [Bacteroidales bacterium]|nr:hypothetical protein [Bacteroidales bacterium]
MKILFLILYMMISYLSFSQSDTINNLINKVLFDENVKIKITYKKTTIPNSIKKELKNKYGVFRIANPNIKYQQNDVIRFPWQLPDNQMLFLINKGNYYAFIFIHGGRGKSINFIFCELDRNKKIRNIDYFYMLYKVKSIDDFFYAIKNEKYKKNKMMYGNIE